MASKKLGWIGEDDAEKVEYIQIPVRLPKDLLLNCDKVLNDIKLKSHEHRALKKVSRNYLVQLGVKAVLARLAEKPEDLNHTLKVLGV